MRKLFLYASAIAMMACSLTTAAADKSPLPTSMTGFPSYAIQPGDILTVSVWKEEGLQDAVLVRPDGNVSFPLVGDVTAAGKTIEQLRTIMVERLQKYIPDPVVTVGIKELGGNKIYVIGKVNRPGDFIVTRYVDVMQALSMAGGTNAFAAVNDIKILRRENGEQRAIPFRYSDVESGKRLNQNIILQGGDTVIVP
ncbi:MAG: polysaccharide biosynthesis/export family protein [Gammaproteobacteria bacterium]